MLRYKLVKELNLYKTQDATRRAKLLEPDDSIYYINIPTLADGESTPERLELWLESNDLAGTIGWVNVADFMDSTEQFIKSDDCGTYMTGASKDDDETPTEEESTPKEVRAPKKYIVRIKRNTQFTVDGKRLPEWATYTEFTTEDLSGDTVKISHSGIEYVVRANRVINTHKEL